MNNNSNNQLIPPFRFAIIEENLYRGSYPTEKNLRFLKRLKLKTIVSLTPKPPLKPFYNFCERYGIVSKHFPASKFKDDVTIDASQVVQLLELMIDPSNLPLYCHCLDGANVTGTIFMCLRKLQNWNLSAIISEFTRFTRGCCIASSESEFVETFKAEIDVPLTIPQWLWQGVRMTKHPTLKLRLIGPAPTSQQLQQQILQQQQQQILQLHQQQQQHHHPHHQNQQQSQQHLASGSSSAFVPINSPTVIASGSPLGNIGQSQHGGGHSSLLISPLVSGITTNSAPLPSSISIQSTSTNTTTTTSTNSSNQISSTTLTTTASSNTAANTTPQLSVQINSTSIKTPTLIGGGTLSNPNTPSSNSAIPNISTLLTSGGSSTSASGTGSTHSKDKEKDKKKKIEDIKLQFDAGKFNQPVESKSLDALSLERLPSIITSTTTTNVTSSSSTNNNSSTSLTQTVATPNANRTLLQTSSEVAFTNINLLQNLTIARNNNNSNNNNSNNES